MDSCTVMNASQEILPCQVALHQVPMSWHYPPRRWVCKRMLAGLRTRGVSLKHARVWSGPVAMLFLVAFVLGAVAQKSGIFTRSLVQASIDGDNLQDTQLQALRQELEQRSAYLRSLVEDVELLEPRAARSKKKVELRERAASSSSLVKLSPMFQIDANLAKFASVPIGSPVPGELTSGFGYRDSPFSEGGFSKGGFHEGVDFAVEAKTPVRVTGDGIVLFAGRKGGYGKTIIVLHKDSTETLYAHLSKISVEQGAKVCRGQEIGLVGMTGSATGPHLHYEVRVRGVARDPMKYVTLGTVVTAETNQPKEMVPFGDIRG